MTAPRSELEVEVLAFEEIHALPGSWDAARLRALLERFDYEDAASVPESELAEMTAMAAQDLGQREAADRVLELVFGATMSPGVRQNLIDDLTGERPWELHADLERQAGIFRTVELLQRAFPNDYGVPDAARARVRIRGAAASAMACKPGGPEAAWLLRVLAGAMDERAVLRRLYAEQLLSQTFPEAASILWSSEVLGPAGAGGEPDEAAGCEIEIHSSLQWIGPLRDSKGLHHVRAHPDRSEA